MHLPFPALAIVGIALCGACTTTADAARLRLLLQDAPPFQPGDQIVVKLFMTEIGPVEAVGFQAFLSFDSSELAFVAATYVPVPFGLPVIPIIVANGEDIDMASGIDVANGQSGTISNSQLVTLVFDAVSEFCLPNITFRTHDPPTRISDSVGMPILPLVLDVIGVTSDCNGNDVEDTCDIADGTSRDCNFNTVPDECETLSCPADLTGLAGVPDGEVGILDFLFLLSKWGPDGCADFTSPVPGVPDGIVGINDFLALLAAWGPCP